MLLKDIYGPTPDFPLMPDAQAIDLPSDADPSLVQEIQRFPIGCMPSLPKGTFALEWIERLLGQRWGRTVMSLLVYSLSYSRYNRVSVADLAQTANLINKVAQEPTWPTEWRAFVIHSLLAYIVPYRHQGYFLRGSPGYGTILQLPTWNQGTLLFSGCRFDEEVDICRGPAARAWVPLEGRGTPTVIFHGTLCWNCAPGAGVCIVDDFNPLGIGERIRQGARRTLRPLLESYRERFGEGAVVIGHSLGGLIATGLAIDLPNLVSRVLAFGPPKPSRAMSTQWRNIQAKSRSSAPAVFTFFGSFDNAPDPVIRMGEVWIGRVFSIQFPKKLPAMLRHMVPLGLPLAFGIQELDNSCPPSILRRSWWALQRLGATAIYCVLMPILVLKRMLVGAWVWLQPRQSIAKVRAPL